MTSGPPFNAVSAGALGRSHSWSPGNPLALFPLEAVATATISKELSIYAATRQSTPVAVSTSGSPGLPRRSIPQPLAAAIELGHDVSVVCGSAYAKTLITSPQRSTLVAATFPLDGATRSIF